MSIVALESLQSQGGWAQQALSHREQTLSEPQSCAQGYAVGSAVWGWLVARVLTRTVNVSVVIQGSCTGQLPAALPEPVQITLTAIHC